MGGGIGMGNTCKPMAVSFQCMTKSTTNKKKRSKKKIKPTMFLYNNRENGAEYKYLTDTKTYTHRNLVFEEGNILHH